MKYLFIILCLYCGSLNAHQGDLIATPQNNIIPSPHHHYKEPSTEQNVATITSLLWMSANFLGNRNQGFAKAMDKLPGAHISYLIPIVALEAMIVFLSGHFDFLIPVFKAGTYWSIMKGSHHFYDAYLYDFAHQGLNYAGQTKMILFISHFLAQTGQLAFHYYSPLSLFKTPLYYVTYPIHQNAWWQMLSHTSQDWAQRFIRTYYYALVNAVSSPLLPPKSKEENSP